MVLYTFFADATSGSVTAVLDRENLVRKIEFPRLVVPLSVILLAYFNLALNLLAVLVFVLATGVEPRLEWFALPLMLFPLGAFAGGIAMLLSALYVRFRDLKPIWEVIVQIAFYASPILYVIEMLPTVTLQHLVIWFNPLATILVQARHSLIDENAPNSLGRRRRIRVPAHTRHDRRRAPGARLLGVQPRGAADSRGALASSEKKRSRRSMRRSQA